MSDPAINLEVLPAEQKPNVFTYPPPQVHPKPLLVKDKAGRVYGNVTIVRFHELRQHHRPDARHAWLAQCSCGKYLITTKRNLEKVSDSYRCSDCRSPNPKPIRERTLVVRQHQPKTLKQAPTLYNLFQGWIKSRNVSLSTQAHYAICLQCFELFIAGKQLNRKTWTEYLEYLVAKGLKASSLRKRVEIPVRAFKWAKREKFITGDWWEGDPIRLPPIVKTKKVIFTNDEYERMKAATSGSTAHLQYQLIVTLYATGMSPVDVCLLKWPSVDFEGQMLRFIRGKMITRGGQECSVPIITDSDFHKLLLEQFTAKDERKPVWTDVPYVFPELARYRLRGIDYAQARCEPGGHNDLWQMVKYVMKRAGITGKSLKTFRNTFCSDMMASGNDSITVCQMTGHSNPKQLLEYCTPDTSVLHEATLKRMEYARSRAITAPKQLQPI